MKSYSQSQEDLFVLNYFGDYKGTLLSIGENDGTTLSNSKLLIENGWSAYLFEPGIVCAKLYDLHRNNRNVRIYPFGVGEREEKVNFWESGPHILGGNDHGLVSTTDFSETLRWPEVKFIQREIELVPFSMIAESGPFEFISIDAEGYDWKILQQIDLTAVGCRVLCIEWNSLPELKDLFTNYCANFGMKLAVQNGENLIFVR